MIQANELRSKVSLIKGIYTDDETDQKKETICKFLGSDPFNNDYFWVDSKDKIEEFDYFEGIELTEDVLLKCGFVKSESDPDNAWLNLKYRFLNFSSDESVGFKKVYLMLGKTEVICDYLHQLQNLYFVLTQTELEINL